MAFFPSSSRKKVVQRLYLNTSESVRSVCSRAGALSRSTGFTGMLNGLYCMPVRLSVPVHGYSRKEHRKEPIFPEGKEPLLISMADTLEIEYTLVQNIEGKSDLIKHLKLRKRKTDGRFDADAAVCKQCNSVVKLAEGTSNMSTHMLRHYPLLLVGSPVGNKLKADALVRILYRYTDWCRQACGPSVCFRFWYGYSSR